MKDIQVNAAGPTVDELMFPKLHENALLRDSGVHIVIFLLVVVGWFGRRFFFLQKLLAVEWNK